MIHAMEKMSFSKLAGCVSAVFSHENARKWQAFAAMAVCSRARVGPGLAPLAAAYFAAGMNTPDTGPAMLAGCVLGAFLTGFEGAALMAPAACALVLVLHMLLLSLESRISGAGMDAPSRAALTAGLATLLPALAAAGFDPWAWTGGLVWAICAALAAPVMLAKNVWWCAPIRILISGAAVTLAAAGLGLDPAPAAAFCVLCAAGAGRGALAGAALGAICAFTGGGVGPLGTLCAMGASADIAPECRFSGPLRAAAAAFAYGAITLMMDLAFSPWIFCAAALYALVPGKFTEQLERSCAPPAKRDLRLMQALRRRDGDKLRALSDAFASLSDACGAGDPAFGEQQLITRMRAALCAGCSEYEKCWPGRDSGAVKLFCQLMTSAIECGGSPFAGGEVPPDIMRLCRRGMTVPSRLGALLTDFAAQRHRRIRLMEARRLIGAQFAQAAGILNTMADAQTRPFMLRDGPAAHVRGALMAENMPVRDVAAVRFENMEITVELSQPWTRAWLDRAARIIGGVMDSGFVPAAVTGNTAAFAPAGRLKAYAASSALPADPDHPCGDSCLIRSAPGHLFVALSDGMGSGEPAAEESCRVTTLMYSLASAGLPRQLSAATVNGVLLSRGGEELFATADMLTIDLNTGRAEFTKLAACRSYILRGGRIHPVEGGQLPLGILDEVNPGIQDAELRRGDIIVMMTDGVADAMNENMLMEVMRRITDYAPEDMARALIDAAAIKTDRRDDMTAVCVKIA